MTSLTIGWIAGVLLLLLGGAVGWVARPYYEQRRNTKTPAPLKAVPPVFPADPVFPPAPPAAPVIPGWQPPAGVRVVRPPAPPEQPPQVARTPAAPATVPPLPKRMQPKVGRHRPETVTTTTIPVIKPAKEVS